jgi:hypothetical protein
MAKVRIQTKQRAIVEVEELSALDAQPRVRAAERRVFVRKRVELLGRAARVAELGCGQQQATQKDAEMVLTRESDECGKTEWGIRCMCAEWPHESRRLLMRQRTSIADAVRAVIV